MAGLLCSSAILGPAFGAETASPPDFAPSDTVGWIAYAAEFIQPPRGPGPVSYDPAHPFVPNVVEYRANPNAKFRGKQTTYPVADLSNPILLPSTRDALAKLKAGVLAGKPLNPPRSACVPMGTPSSMLYPVAPIYFLQTPKEVLIITEFDNLVRHIYLNAKHSAHIKPSWFGESVGHYEGDTLVVDTIGLNDKTYVDGYLTPHSPRLHTVERYHLINGAKTLEADLYVEDPGAFTMPWNAIQRWTRKTDVALFEQPCAENNPDYFHEATFKTPVALKPDF
jgi:hypothetical protein